MADRDRVSRERRAEWRDLGLDPTERDRLDRWRSVPTLSPTALARMERRLAASVTRPRPVGRYSTLAYLAWMVIRLSPGGTVGASLGLVVLGSVWTAFAGSSSAALWSVVAPWMAALGVAAVGPGSQRGALGLLVRQAPADMGIIRLVVWGFLTTADALLIGSLAVAGLGRGPALAVLGAWFGPFLVTLAVALLLRRLLARRLYQVLLMGALGMNSVMGVAGLTGHGALLAPVAILLEHASPVVLLLSTVVIAGMARVELAHPALRA